MRKSIFGLFVVGTLIASCGKKPEACFSVGDEKNLKLNQNVKFLSCSINAKKYDWDFGDGNTVSDSEPNVTHKYTAIGNYTVKLTVRSNGKKSESQKVITVK